MAANRSDGLYWDIVFPLCSILPGRPSASASDQLIKNSLIADGPKINRGSGGYCACASTHICAIAHKCVPAMGLSL